MVCCLTISHSLPKSAPGASAKTGNTCRRPPPVRGRPRAPLSRSTSTPATRRAYPLRGRASHRSRGRKCPAEDLLRGWHPAPVASSRPREVSAPCETRAPVETPATSPAPPSGCRSSWASVSMPPTGHSDVNSGHSMLMEYSRSGYGFSKVSSSSGFGMAVQWRVSGPHGSRVILALARLVHAFNIASGPVHSAPAIAAARTAWRHPPPGIAGGHFLSGVAQRSTPRALLLSQPPRHLLENTPLLARQALEPLGGDLVEYAVNVFGFQVARGNLSTRRNCRRPLRGDRLALRHDLVHFLNTLARTRQRSRDRARWILGVGHLRDSLSQLLDAHTWRRSHVQPRDDEPTEVSKVRDVGPA